MGSVSALPSYLQVVDLDDGTQYTQLLIGTINGIYWIGVMCGALIVGWFSERVGRRKAVVFWGIFGLVIVPLFVSLQSFAWALVLRFFNGFFTGAFDSVGLNWSAESVDARHRGRAIGLQLCCAASGASISYFIVYGLSKSASSDIIWRLPLAFQLIFALFILSMVYFLPESPRWLARVGLIEEAKDVLRAMKSGANAEERYAAADADLVSILEAIRLEVDSDSSATYWQMFTARDKLHTSRRTWSALFVQFGVQAMAGVGVVSGYGVKIFETGGWSTETAALLSGFGIITQAAFGIPGALWADRIGRRRAMVYGAIVGSILLALIGICGHYVHLDAHTNPRRAKSYGAATVALVEVWSAVFGLTWCKLNFSYFGQSANSFSKYSVHSYIPRKSSPQVLEQKAALLELLDSPVARSSSTWLARTCSLRLDINRCFSFVD
jgi:MFS family permease